MGRNSQTKFFEVLKWALLISLFGTSMWFMTDVLDKFQNKITSLNNYQEILTDLPTTVVCFQPLAKPTILEKYGFTTKDLQEQDLVLDLPNTTWSEFYDEAYYKLNRDFLLSVRFGGSILLEIGKNIINNATIQVEEVFTLRSGKCYKIMPDFISFEKITYAVIFNTNLTKIILPDLMNYEELNSKDIPPIVYCFVTSKNNANGIVGQDWSNGEELIFPVEKYINEYKLKAFHHKQLPHTSNCSHHSFDKCVMDGITNNNYSCKNPCLATSLLSKNSSNMFPICKNIKEYMCMRNEIEEILETFQESCPKYCSVFQYTGRPSIIKEKPEYQQHIKFWAYKFVSKYAQVNEEYMVYDAIGLIGTVGGTLGLFIGFSFRDVIDYFINKMSRLNLFNFL